jgi:NAD(P)-dependent dehydrogenase (short-subunit alcohol dehydrogenase family)
VQVLRRSRFESLGVIEPVGAVEEQSMSTRTYIVTGAASGIGAATARLLRERGDRVIACDLHDADVIGDLATVDGRAAVVDGVARLCGEKLDGIVANAGGGPPDTMLSLNFFGAVATLESLRPWLVSSAAPRAIAVSSISSLGPTDPALVDVCLTMDEPAAIATSRDSIAAGKDPLALYGSAKHALNRWCRRRAAEADWAGAGIALNVIAPGIIDTAAAAYILSTPAIFEELGRRVPLRGAYPGRPEQLAALVAWCVSPANCLMTGQVLFADGGFECQARGETVW